VGHCWLCDRSSCAAAGAGSAAIALAGLLLLLLPVPPLLILPGERLPLNLGGGNTAVL